MQENFIKLTNTAYRVIEFFPEADPLKNRAKDKALAIMDGLAALDEAGGWMSFQLERVKRQALDDIDILLGYFWIAKMQGWINSTNYLILAGEYEKVKKDITPAIELTRKIPFNHSTAEKTEAIMLSKEIGSEEPKLSGRQVKIIDFLDKNSKAQVMDLQKVLSGVTKRTIRRDLEELIKTGKVVRVGQFNSVFYQIGQKQA